ncbi:hypothetical protein ACFWTE_04735 [Nocardiopsis sp. NPDC058631]|uniref:hypothetical protein n=1 Tax=Nocardiopsis sp. NPDC058631 TaxID=3346566 RepID=UPI0036666B6B
MSDFSGGSREKTIVFGILAALVVALVVLAQQILSDPDEEAAPPTDASVESGGGEAVGDVMSLMPYSEAEIRSGAEIARGFIEAYSEIDPDENSEDRLARLSPLIAEEFFGTVENLILTTPNSGTSRDPQRTSASAVVTGIRNVGTAAIIFEVEVRTLSDSGEDEASEPLAYAVTMVPEDDSWAVYAFQDASIGNDGEGA